MAVLFSGFALLRDPGLFSVAQMQLSHTYEQKCFSQWVGAQAAPGTVRLSGEVCHFGGMELRIRTSGAAASANWDGTQRLEAKSGNTGSSG